MGNNGKMYEYSNANSASAEITEFLEETGNEVSYVESASQWVSRAQTMSAAQKFGVVAGTGVLVGAAVALFIRFRTSAEDDSKEESLIDDEWYCGTKGRRSIKNNLFFLR